MAKKVSVVIPTIRTECFNNWLEEWTPELWNKHVKSHLIVVEDNNKKTIKIPQGLDISYYNHNDIDKELKDKAWIISRKDSAIRCFGFLKAEEKYIATFDDDTSPSPNILKRHIGYLNRPSHPTYFNTTNDEVRFQRGYPFEIRKGVKTMLNHGLWLNVPDFDAVTQLQHPKYTAKSYAEINTTVPRDMFYSMCGMNICFRKEIRPIMYFGLNGMANYKLGRWDDMFAGYCSKKIIDHLGYGVRSGLPFVTHNKASDPHVNLEKEKPTYMFQYDFVKFLSNIKLQNKYMANLYAELGLNVCTFSMSKGSKYFSKVGNAMVEWSALFQ